MFFFRKINSIASNIRKRSRPLYRLSAPLCFFRAHYWFVFGAMLTRFLTARGYSIHSFCLDGSE